MTVHGLLMLHGALATPYDQPKGLRERLLFPMLRVAYREGYQDGCRAQFESDRAQRGGKQDSEETFAQWMARQSDDAAEAKFGVRPNGTTRRTHDYGQENDR